MQVLLLFFFILILVLVAFAPPFVFHESVKHETHTHTHTHTFFTTHHRMDGREIMGAGSSSSPKALQVDTRLPKKMCV